MMTIIIGFSGHAHLKLLGISNRLAFYTLALGHDTWHLSDKISLATYLSTETPDASVRQAVRVEKKLTLCGAWINIRCNRSRDILLTWSFLFKINKRMFNWVSLNMT